MLRKSLWGFVASVAVLGLVSSPVHAEQQIMGQRPPALAPYAENDPLPKLTLKPSSRQDTPRQAVETFLAHLSASENVANAPTGGSLPGSPQGFERALALMVDDGRPSLSQFKERWHETARLGVVQLEPMDRSRFFVEIERIAFCDGNWAVSYYAGHISALQTPQGWRIKEFDIHPENLVRVNIGGHPGLKHDEVSLARILTTTPQGRWEVQTITYAGRVATVRLREKGTEHVREVRMARTAEGSWELLSMR